MLISSQKAKGYQGCQDQTTADNHNKNNNNRRQIFAFLGIKLAKNDMLPHLPHLPHLSF